MVKILLLTLSLFSISARAAYINTVQVTSGTISVQQLTSPWVTSVNNFPSVQVVSGTAAISNFPSVQVVSGTVGSSQIGQWDITNISGTISLPTGASTAAAQGTTNTYLASIDTKLTAPITVSGSGTVGSAPVNPPVSVSGVDDSGLKRHLKTNTLGHLYTIETWSYSYINTATTTLVKTGAGLLSMVCYTTPQNGATVTVYDNTTATAPIIFVLTPPNGAAPFCINLDSVAFNTGLTVVTNTVAGVLVVYK